MKALRSVTQISLVALVGMLALALPAVGRESVRPDSSAVVFNSQSANHAIYSYDSVTPAITRHVPTVLYVSRAYGPAIHGYAHAGAESVGAWDVEYVSRAYGPAIYSYPSSHRLDGDVLVLPLRTLMD
jgi:hypothetical protein